jgi:hypothetical protein
VAGGLAAVEVSRNAILVAVGEGLSSCSTVACVGAAGRRAERGEATRASQSAIASLSAPRRPLASARRLLLDGAVLRDAERDAFDLVEACLPFAGDRKDGLHHRVVVVLLRRDEESLQEVQVLEEYSSCVGGPIVHTWPCASASAVKRIDKSVKAIARTGGDVKRWLREDPAAARARTSAGRPLGSAPC